MFVSQMLFHPVIGDRVYLAEQQARSTKESSRFHFFTVEDQLTYVPFGDDFGPMNLSAVQRFVEILESKLDAHRDFPVVYCVDFDARKITNATFLLGCYMILRMHLSPETVWSAFDDISETMTGFRDSTFEEPDFLLTLLDCWRGLDRANSLGWVSMYDLE